MSYGSLWYGKRINFPGFLYKMNTGVGVGKSNSHGLICNNPTSFNNKYITTSGIGASNASLRSVKRMYAGKCYSSQNP